MGRASAQSGWWIIWQRSPSISTTSPCSRAWSCSTYRRVVRHDSAFWFNVHRAVAPVPNPHASRPGATRSMVAMADAVVITWRRLGTSTAAPKLISVCSAMRASQIQMSS